MRASGRRSRLVSRHPGKRQKHQNAAMCQNSQPDRARLDRTLQHAAHGRVSKMRHAFSHKGRSCRSCPVPVPTRGKLRKSGRHSVQIEPGEFAREGRERGLAAHRRRPGDSESRADTSDASNKKRGRIDNAARAGRAGETDRGHPQGEGREEPRPGHQPTRNVLTTSMHHEQDGQAALPRMLEADTTDFRGCRAARSHARRSPGPVARPARPARGMRPAPPIMVPNETDLLGTSAIRSKAWCRLGRGRRGGPSLRKTAVAGDSSTSSCRGSPGRGRPGLDKAIHALGTGPRVCTRARAALSTNAATTLPQTR